MIIFIIEISYADNSLSQIISCSIAPICVLDRVPNGDADIPATKPVLL